VTTVNSPTFAETASTPLTNADRCDRCGVAARTRVTLPTGGELLFCGHHTRAHAPQLLDLGAMLSH
jgi:hypothetical protein